MSFDIPVEEITFKGICSAMLEAENYAISMAMRVGYNRQAAEILSCTCNCFSAVNLEGSAHGKHVLALVYAIAAVVNARVVPEWPVCSSSLDQGWDIRHSSSARGDLRPDRASISAYFLRPDKRGSWKRDNKNRVGFGMASTEELTAIRQHAVEHRNIYPAQNHSSGTGCLHLSSSYFSRAQ